jgi:hypothetical protein
MTRLAAVHPYRIQSFHSEDSVREVSNGSISNWYTAIFFLKFPQTKPEHAEQLTIQSQNHLRPADKGFEALTA